MKETSFSTDGADLDYEEGTEELKNKHSGKVGAVLGTGCSVEGLDLAVLDTYDFTIGMNESPKIYGSTYLMILDERAIAKVMGHLEPYFDSMTPVVARKIIHFLSHTPPFSKEGVAADEVFAKMGRMHTFKTGKVVDGQVFCGGGGALAGALSLAKWVGCKELHLYGCDFYRRFSQKYAYSLNDSPAERMIPVDKHETRFTTPAMIGMMNGIEKQRAVWEPMRVLNMNPLSELRCFEGGRTDEW